MAAAKRKSPKQKDDTKRAIGARIRKAREEAHLNQLQLGELIGNAGPTVNQYEQGTRGVSLDLLERLSLALRRPISYFWPRAGTESPFGVFAFHYERLSPEDQRLVDQLVERLDTTGDDASAT